MQASSLIKKLRYFQWYVKQVRSNNGALVLALQLSEKTNKCNRKYETDQFLPKNF